jgi:transcriptional regulator with XRE-family HTH domain
MKFEITARLLRNVRKTRGLSQAAIGKACGCSSVHISNIENGKSGIPRAMIKRLCKKLDWKIEDFIQAHMEDYEAIYRRNI